MTPEVQVSEMSLVPPVVRKSKDLSTDGEAEMDLSDNVRPPEFEYLAIHEPSTSTGSAKSLSHGIGLGLGGNDFTILASGFWLPGFSWAGWSGLIMVVSGRSWTVAR